MSTCLICGEEYDENKGVCKCINICDLAAHDEKEHKMNARVVTYKDNKVQAVYEFNPFVKTAKGKFYNHVQWMFDRLFRELETGEIDRAEIKGI